MDRTSRATLALRVGTLLVAAGLAFGMLAYTSGLTVSGYHGDVSLCGLGCYYGNAAVAPGDSYQVLTSWDQASPQQMYFLNMTSNQGSLEVFFLDTNQTTFNMWIASRSGLSLSNLSFYAPRPLAWFSDYIASHRQEVASQYGISQTYTVVRHLVPDVEPLMVVLTNGNDHALNLSYYATSVSITINPTLGSWATGCLVGPGIFLVALGLVQRRRQTASPSNRKA